MSVFWLRSLCFRGWKLLQISQFFAKKEVNRPKIKVDFLDHLGSKTGNGKGDYLRDPRMGVLTNKKENQAPSGLGFLCPLFYRSSKTRLKSSDIKKAFTLKAFLFVCGATGIRTPDLLTASQAL